ncbi:MAG: GerAB/ArcD/ProY family transporter [Clostridia bacterium]|nr:GerAB/ArcD/ProY family transporter [Clostridia bacterium]
MNHREGRFGVQEAAAVATIALAISSVFSIDAPDIYADGNVMWLASAFALVISAVLFLCLAQAMERQGCESLPELAGRVFGGFFGGLLNLILILLLIFAAVTPLFRFMFLITDFVFIDASQNSISVYFLICCALLAMLGMEVIARSARLLIWLVVIAFGLAFLFAAPSLEAYRLYPMPGAGGAELIRQTALSVFRYLTPLLALLTVAKGAHGVRYTKKAGLIALAAGGLLSLVCQLFTGLRYSYAELAQMDAPLYRLVMDARYSQSSLRLDKAILFIWVIAGILSAAYYVYCASLTFVRTFKTGDIRPVAALMSCFAIAALLLLALNTDGAESTMSFAQRYAWLILLVPVFALCIAGTVKRRRAAQ